MCVAWSRSRHENRLGSPSSKLQALLAYPSARLLLAKPAGLSWPSFSLDICLNVAPRAGCIQSHPPFPLFVRVLSSFLAHTFALTLVVGALLTHACPLDGSKYRRCLVCHCPVVKSPPRSCKVSPCIMRKSTISVSLLARSFLLAHITSSSSSGSTLTSISSSNPSKNVLTSLPMPTGSALS